MMGYMKIPNLYKCRSMLTFKEVYALEKIHGTSAHIKYQLIDDKPTLTFYSGGAKHDQFVALFNQEELLQTLSSHGAPLITVYGEAYGGKVQKMTDVYGKELRFVVFDVKVGDRWLDVPKAEGFAKLLNLEFVDYGLVSTDLEVLNHERDKPSVQAIRNGCGDDKEREGVVLRPPFEITLNNGCRLIAKYKAEKFRETTAPREVNNERLKVLQEADAIANEWATEMRLNHILGKIPDELDISLTGQVIKAMVEDIRLEAEGEIVLSRQAIQAINKKTAQMFKQRVKGSL